MKVIVCVDDNLGILFNKRRVSKDSKIIEDIISNYEDIYINEYSKELFIDNYIVSDKLEEGINFVENNSLLGMEDKITEVIIYYFNRKYPSDLKLELDLNKYNEVSKTEFVGSSHDKITKVVYEVVK